VGEVFNRRMCLALEVAISSVVKAPLHSYVVTSRRVLVAKGVRALEKCLELAQYW
jgi:hypothetical protein